MFTNNQPSRLVTLKKEFLYEKRLKISDQEIELELNPLLSYLLKKDNNYPTVNYCGNNYGITIYLYISWPMHNQENCPEQVQIQFQEENLTKNPRIDRWGFRTDHIVNAYEDIYVYCQYNVNYKINPEKNLSPKRKELFKQIFIDYLLDNTEKWVAEIENGQK